MTRSDKEKRYPASYLLPSMLLWAKRPNWSFFAVASTGCSEKVVLSILTRMMTCLGGNGGRQLLIFIICWRSRRAREESCNYMATCELLLLLLSTVNSRRLPFLWIKYGIRWSGEKPSKPPTTVIIRGASELNTKESALDGDGGARLDGWMRLGSFRFEMNEDVRGNMG